MCAISSLMCSDLLSLDQIFAVTRQHLQQLSQGSPGPVANRATKVTPRMSSFPVCLSCQFWCHPALGNGSMDVPEGQELSMSPRV